MRRRHLGPSVRPLRRRCGRGKYLAGGPWRRRSRTRRKRLGLEMEEWILGFDSGLGWSREEFLGWVSG